jgi:hypothetical protein
MRSMNHPTDWDRQQERLSAYLDGALGAEERRELERHLPRCAECQTALAELRRVRALLHALPAPRLPRSFMLPEAGDVGSPRHDPVVRQPSAARARPAWYGASQWAGGLAACVGLFLLLGSGLLGLTSPHPTSFGASPRQDHVQSAGVQSTTTPTGAQTPRIPNPVPSHSQPEQVGATTSASPTVSPSVAPTPTPGSTVPRDSELPAPGPNLPLLPLTGAGLLAGGAVLVVVGRVARRRRGGTSG